MCSKPCYALGVVIVADTVVPLATCLASLTADAEHAEASTGARTLICVVDNGSGDEVVDWTAAHYPDIARRRLAAPRNVAGAINAGLDVVRREGATYFFLLRPDTQIPTGLISGLVDIMDRYGDYGLIEPLQYRYTPGDATLGEHSRRSAQLLAWTRAQSGRETESTPPVPGPGSCYRTRTAPGAIDGVFLDGSALVGRSALLDRTGLLDEAYRTDYAIDDLLRRAHLDGWRTAVLTDLGIQRREPPGTEDGHDDPCDEWYYLACNPTRDRPSLPEAVRATMWHCEVVVHELRLRPRDTLAAIRSAIGASAWIVCRWPRVRRRRRELHALERHPTWNTASLPYGAADTAPP